MLVTIISMVLLWEVFIDHDFSSQVRTSETADQEAWLEEKGVTQKVWSDEDVETIGIYLE